MRRHVRLNAKAKRPNVRSISSAIISNKKMITQISEVNSFKKSLNNCFDSIGGIISWLK